MWYTVKTYTAWYDNGSGYFEYEIDIEAPNPETAIKMAGGQMTQFYTRRVITAAGQDPNIDKSYILEPK